MPLNNTNTNKNNNKHNSNNRHTNNHHTNNTNNDTEAGDVVVDSRGPLGEPQHKCSVVDAAAYRALCTLVRYTFIMISIIISSSSSSSIMIVAILYYIMYRVNYSMASAPSPQEPQKICQ